ncbi:Apolipoprotein D, partial [Pseudolycoriella hygida]
MAILAKDAASEAKQRSTCREPNIMQNFDITRWVGRWYIYSRHDHHFERGCDCMNTDVQAIDATSLRILSCCQMSALSNDTQTCDVGVNYAKLINPEKKDGDFKTTRVGVTAESRAWIIYTDYDNYGIVSGCDNFSDTEELETFWILSRDKTISPSDATKIDEVLKANNFERSRIINQRHGENVKDSNRTQTCGFGVDFARIADPEKMDGDFFYTISGVPTESRLWIVDTDYENYGIIDGCARVSDTEEQELLWILSRDKIITSTEESHIDKVLADNNFDQSLIVKQKQGRH